MPYDLVTVAIEGTIVKKGDLRHTTRGTALYKFGMVCMPKWIQSDKEIPEDRRGMYFTVMAMGKMASTVYPMIRCGMPVRVEGEYRDGTYRDALTDEPKVGRLIFASRVRVFVFYKHRGTSKRAKEEGNQLEHITIPNLDDLPF